MNSQADVVKLARDLAPQIAHNPRPRATLRVGAIGRRKLDPALVPAIEASVTRVLNEIRNAAESVLARPETAAQYSEGLDLFVVTPLAEGADRLIAGCAPGAGYRLGAILPFDRATYEATFDLGDNAAAVARFRALLASATLPVGYGVIALDGASATDVERNASYHYCAATVARWSDLMIAIVDPKDRESQSGQSVDEATGFGIPVIIIDPGNPASISLRIGPDLVSDLPTALEKLGRRVEGCLAPSGRPAEEETGWLGRWFLPPEHYTMDDYLKERVDIAPTECNFEYTGPFVARALAPTMARWCSGLNRRFDRIFRFPGDKDGNVPMKDIHVWDLPLDREALAPIADLYLRYLRADALASAYAELHRSVHIVIALLGFLTVTMAASSAQFHSLAVYLGAVEFLALSAALALVIFSHYGVWLDRWLDCRLLAEIFRYSKFLVLTGRPSPFADWRAGKTERTWTHDHIRNVLRTQRMAGPAHGTANATDVAAIADYVSSRCVADQINYHTGLKFLRLRQSWLFRFLGILTAGVTWLVVTTKLGVEFALVLEKTAEVARNGSAVHLYYRPDLWEKGLAIAAIVLPALTAAIFALRAFGEHQIVGLRSERMVGWLKEQQVLLLSSRNLQTLGDHTVTIARELLRHVGGWQELFSAKHLES